MKMLMRLKGKKSGHYSAVVFPQKLFSKEEYDKAILALLMAEI
jgi:hypothetical protein